MHEKNDTSLTAHLKMFSSSESFLSFRYCLNILAQWLDSIRVSTLELVTSALIWGEQTNAGCCFFKNKWPTCISYKRSSKLWGGVGTCISNCEGLEYICKWFNLCSAIGWYWSSGVLGRTLYNKEFCYPLPSLQLHPSCTGCPSSHLVLQLLITISSKW